MRVRTAVDAAVREAASTTNYGEAAGLWVNGGTAGNDRQSFIHWTRPFPLGARILSATLYLYARAAWTTGTGTLSAKRVTAKWSEGLITWTNRPAVSATNAGSVVPGTLAVNQEFTVDVTAMMQDVSNGSPYFGVRLEITGDVDRTLHSSEALNADYRPALDVVWTMPPDPPSDLSPSGGLAVSLTKPVLSWVFTDPRHEIEQASSQVQISTTTSFATPEYDSGKVANVDPTWDLAATAYAGVPADATRYWRVKVWDSNDIASDWSDTVSFIRKTQGTLAITSPTATPIDDLTPTITWTLTGRTQEAYRVVILKVPAGLPSTEVWDSGRLTGAATSIQVPAGVIVSGQSYRVRVRTWDTIDRTSSYGDTTYVDQTFNFTYNRSGVPANVPTLTAVPDATKPLISLTWTRANQPDYFALKVDGVEVLPRIVPADVFVSGTTYRMSYWGGVPRVSRTFEVEAVVLSAGKLQHSSGNATAAASIDPTGVWVFDPEDTSDASAVRIVGRDNVDMAIGEEAATYTILGGRAPVRITDTVRGYEGSVSGHVKGKADRNQFLALKGALKTLRMIAGDLNIPIRLEEVAVAPTALNADRLYAVSFSFVQVGEFSFEVVG